ncbi:MAG: LamG domain-containing protein [Planctomycetales bacterium]|nr:LamG domain-containing protein [Planctomycetales bacterium]
MTRNTFNTCRALAVLLIAAFTSSPASADLVGYWDFEGSAVDRSGSGLDGTLAGDAAYDADTPPQIQSASSVLLDGDGDWVSLGNPSELNFGTEDWTVAGWLKTTRTGLGDENEGTLFGNGGDWQGGIRYTIVLSEGGIEGVPTLVIDDDAAAPGSRFNKQVLNARTAVNDGNWHHVVGVRSEGELQIYVDGNFEGSARFNPAYDLTGLDQHPAYIGAITDNRNGEVFKMFDGRLDDVAIWNEALSSDVIAGLAAGTVTPLTVPEPSTLGLLVFWMVLVLRSKRRGR